MLLNTYPKQSTEEGAGAGSPAVEVAAVESPAADPVEPAASQQDVADLRAKLQAASARKNRELAAANESLSVQLKAEQDARAELTKRLESLEASAKKAGDKERSDKVEALLSAAKVKKDSRAFALHQLGAAFDPDAADAASKVDEWAKGNALHLEVESMTRRIQSPWLSQPQQRDPNARPTGRDFMPPDRIPH